MRVPVSWLRDFVDVALPPDELADLLTNAGLEVSSVERLGIAGADLEWERDKVVLSQIVSVERHPDADRLVLAEVDHGVPATKQVVTGAPNLFDLVGEGDLRPRRLFSPLLLEGGSYLDPYKSGSKTRLKGREVRGVYNDAMLCSPVELGLGEEHDGILILVEAPGEGYVAGIPLVDVLGDAVLDVDIIPNIARCASVLGVAREVAALTGVAWREPDWSVTMEGAPLAGRVEIEARDPELNPRFVALLIEGVEQRPSPFWMQHRLRLAGQRPIHVVVDVSNYVMLEMGQPNHTFDYRFLRERADRYAAGGPVRLITRLAEAGESMRTLDGAEHRLHPNNILVTDPEGILSLGGIMGGEESEIRPETTDVLLEAAAWNFLNIRHSARQLGIQTDAAFRFSRGVHPSQAMLGARRAAELLRRLAGGTVAEGIVDHHPRPAPTVTVDLDPARVRRFTGLALDAGEIAELLRRPGFAVAASGEAAGELLRVTVPDHRLDVEGPHDLIEEVCRMVRYERIPETVLRGALPPQRGNPELEREERLRDALVGLGLREVITYRLTTPEAEARARAEAADALDPGAYVRLVNPSTAERSALRLDLLASVLEIAAANTRFRDSVRLFEAGKVFPREDGSPLPAEHLRLAIAMTGARAEEHWEGGATERPERLDYFDLKGVVEELGVALHVALRFVPGAHPSLRPGRTAAILAGPEGAPVGHLGELHPRVVQAYELRVEKGQPVLAASVDLEALLPLVPEAFPVAAPPAYPPVREDLALVVDSGVAAAAVRDALLCAGAPLVTDASLFDVYTGEKLGTGRKSLAYHLTFQAPDRTLSDRDVEKLRGRMLRQLEREIGARLRE
ncbi:MAG TPA: phenylalanine--tRNA ligase subunit beta [Thermoanaerobaculia bacterium]|nr:phenylalanine--tRNA ligase subunit beta [Thermoanaerobaculia bacterium]